MLSSRTGQSTRRPDSISKARALLTFIGALSVQVLQGPLAQRSFALYSSRILWPRLRGGDVLTTT
jgi:hypothetical protein